MEGNLEVNYQNICRICLSIAENMKDLFGLTFPKDESVFVDFLRKMTDLKLQNSESLPKNICNGCTNDVFAAFKLAQMCITSDAKLRNQETRRILRKIEAEALEEEEIVIKCEQPLENYNTQYDNIQDEFCNEEDPLAIANELDEIEKKFNPLPDELQFTTIREKNRYKCENCLAYFNNKAIFRKHQKTHDEHDFKCFECNQTFPKELHLTVHMRSHIKTHDKKFGCNECGKQFVYEYLLKQHEFKHKDEKPFPCTKCDKGCLTAESLRRHMKIHEENYSKKIHICDVCDKSFAYPSFLAEHMKNHTGEKPFFCKICNKGFRQSGALHFHERIHSGYKPFTCNFCNENFMSRSILKVHIRKHTKEKPYVCDICEAAFRQPTDLKNHHRIHTGEKRVLCTVCGKKMSTTGQLTVHLRTHTGEKPFSCQTCSKCFSTMTILRKHKRVHTGERPYRCEICGKSFKQSSTLQTHSKTHKESNNGKLGSGTKLTSRSGKVSRQKEKFRPDLSPHMLPSTAMRSSPEIFENHPVALPRRTTVNIGNNWNMPSPTAGIRKIGNSVTEINR